MFAQGQLLGMKSDLLMRLKTEINAWDKVAERHPYSVYRRNDHSLFTEARTSDPFTTNFGEGLPFRTYDRNRPARDAHQATRAMEQPYPQGYTGHVTKIRHVVGQTYGRQVRDAINSVTPNVELATVTPKETLVSTQQLAYVPPNQEVAHTHQRAANAVSTRRPVNLESRYASSSLLSYPPPPPSSYATPGWSERPTSNIGQYDAYKHVSSQRVHAPELPSRVRLQLQQSQGTITHHASSSGLDAPNSTA
jgi:hypothetical protein